MMDKSEILIDLRQDIEERRNRSIADKDHMVITEDWFEYIEHKMPGRDHDAYRKPNYENWIHISPNLTKKDREQVIQLEKERYSLSAELVDTLLCFLNSTEKASCEDFTVFSGLLGAMEYVDEYYDKKTREEYSRFGEKMLTRTIAERDVSSWPIDLHSDRAYFLWTIAYARMKLLRLLIRDEKEAKNLENVDFDSQVDKEIMGTIKYRNSPCPIEYIYNNKMISQGVKDFMIIMGWQEETTSGSIDSLS